MGGWNFDEMNPGLLGLIDTLAPYQGQAPAPVDPFFTSTMAPGAYGSGPDRFFDQNALNARKTANESLGQIAGLQNQSNGIGVRTGNIRSGQSGIIQGQADADAAWQRQTQGIVDRLGQAGAGANAFDAQALSGYQSALGNYTRQNTQSLGGLQDLYGQLANPLQSRTTWAGDLTSQAAGAYADPNSIAAQNEAMGFLSGAMNGSLNYQSQGAQAYADPQAIAAQYQALGQLQDSAAGGLDVQSQAARAYADQGAIDMQSQGLSGLWRIANGSLDSMPWHADPEGYARVQKGLSGLDDIAGGSLNIKPGDLDPEAYAAQKDALSQFKSLTTPELTDAERFIYEHERIGAERDERANREANMSSLRQRGMGGSGMELTNTALANQQISQNRLLGDLGANRGAIDRSMQALAGYGGLSSTMNQQANELGTANSNRQLQARGAYGNLAQQQNALASQMSAANSDRQLQAMGLYTDQAGRLRSQTFDEAFARGSAADQVAITNANRTLQAQGLAFDAAGNIREQSFNEEYSRGIAADNASANNQRTQLQGGMAYGDMANVQREQSFGEAFKRGSAADQTAQFNRAQSIGVSQWQDQFAQGERNAQWDRGMGMTNTTLRTNEANALNDTRSWESGFKTNEAGYGRTRDALTAQDTANTRQHDNARYVGGLNFDLGNQMANDEQSAFGRNLATTGMGIGVKQNADTAVGASNKDKAGIVATRSAAQDALDLADRNKETSILWGLASW